MSDHRTDTGDAQAASVEARSDADLQDDGADSTSRTMLRNTGAKLGAFASAVGRGAEAAATRAKDVVDTTSDKLETVAQHGPSAARQPAATGTAGSGAHTAAAVAGGAAAGGTAVGAALGTTTTTTTTSQAARPLRRTRKARLRVSRIDPWSVMKTTFLFSIAFAIIQFVAVWILWGVIDASGAFDAVNKTISALVSTDSTNAFQLQDYINAHKVLGLTAILGVVDVLLITALATLFSFLYNLAATVLGGLELTLAED